jgi:hypothetical protein
MKQVRASEDETCKAVKALVDGEETWDDVRQRRLNFLSNMLNRELETRSIARYPN